MRDRGEQRECVCVRAAVRWKVPFAESLTEALHQYQCLVTSLQRPGHPRPVSLMPSPCMTPGVLTNEESSYRPRKQQAAFTLHSRRHTRRVLAHVARGKARSEAHQSEMKLSEIQRLRRKR
jgi:hypothetical protein